jgi:hypothetical protein
MKKAITLLLICATIISCGSQSKSGNDVVNAGEIEMLGLYKVGGIWNYGVLKRYISIKSADKNGVVSVDTFYAYGRQIAIIDSVTHKPKLDSLGYVMTRSIMSNIPKDSVIWRIENKSLLELIDTAKH